MPLSEAPAVRTRAQAARPVSRGRTQAATVRSWSNPPGSRPSSVPPRGKGAGSARGAAPQRSSSAPPRKPRHPPPKRLDIDWKHPDGIPLEDIDEDTVLTGVVTKRAEFGVFVDAGAERDALLGCPARFWRKFWPGDVLDGLTPERIDLQRRQWVVHLPDPEAALAKNRKPLSSFKVGSYVEGVVEAKNKYGIFVNLGAENTGKLNIPRFIGSQLFAGMVLKQVKILDVDVEKQRISLVLEDPEAALSEKALVSLNTSTTKASVKAKAEAKPTTKALVKEAKPKSKAEAVAKEAKPKAKATVKAKSIPPPELDIEAGDFVDGVVTDILSKGVIVDIGLDAMCTLVVSAELKKEFQKGDRVQGMMVEKVSPAGNVTLSMEDPELELDEVPQSKAEAKRKAKAKEASRGRAA